MKLLQEVISCQVLVHAPIALVAFQKFSLDQRLNSFLDDVGVRHEP